MKFAPISGRTKDLTDERFGKLIVIGYVGPSKHQKATWFCECECGGTNTVVGSSLTNGVTTSCGCVATEYRSESQATDMIDETSGLLTVVERDGTNERKLAMWKCECECGNYKTVRGSDLRNKAVLSCGCLHQDDLLGGTFGIRKVVGYAGKDENNRLMWNYECECGNTGVANTSAIKRTFSCGCVGSGFDPSKPAYYYLNKFGVFTKGGITNKLKQRHSQLNNQTIGGTTYTIEDSISWYFKDGRDAVDMESTILDMFEKHAYTALLHTSFDGKTELFENAAHQEILDYIAENYDISYV